MSNPNHETFVKTSQLKMVLASRIIVASNAVDGARSVSPYTSEDFAKVATLVGEGIAVLRELERIWENFFDAVPSSGEVHEWAVRANLSSEV